MTPPTTPFLDPDPFVLSESRARLVCALAHLLDLVVGQLEVHRGRLGLPGPARKVGAVRHRIRLP